MKKFWEIIGIVSAIVGSVCAFSASGLWLVLCATLVVVPLIVEGIRDINKNNNQQNEQENESI